jgi:uncharacterized membrane protein
MVWCRRSWRHDPDWSCAVRTHHLLSLLQVLLILSVFWAFWAVWNLVGQVLNLAEPWATIIVVGADVLVVAAAAWLFGRLRRAIRHSVLLHLWNAARDVTWDELVERSTRPPRR